MPSGPVGTGRAGADTVGPGYRRTGADTPGPVPSGRRGYTGTRPVGAGSLSRTKLDGTRSKREAERHAHGGGGRESQGGVPHPSCRPGRGGCGRRTVGRDLRQAGARSGRRRRRALRPRGPTGERPGERRRRQRSPRRGLADLQGHVHRSAQVVLRSLRVESALRIGRCRRHDRSRPDSRTGSGGPPPAAAGGARRIGPHAGSLRDRAAVRRPRYGDPGVGGGRRPDPGALALS